MKLQSKSETVNPIYLNKVKIPSNFQLYLSNCPDWKVCLEKLILRILYYGQFRGIKWIYNKNLAEMRQWCIGFIKATIMHLDGWDIDFWAKPDKYTQSLADCWSVIYSFIHPERARELFPDEDKDDNKFYKAILENVPEALKSLQMISLLLVMKKGENLDLGQRKKIGRNDPILVEAGENTKNVVEKMNKRVFNFKGRNISLAAFAVHRTKIFGIKKPKIKLEDDLRWKII